MSGLFKNIGGCLLIAAIFVNSAMLIPDANAAVLNRVMTFDPPPDPFQRGIFLGERLFFIDGNSVLHVTDGTAGGTRALIDDVLQPPFGREAIARMRGLVYVIREVQGNRFELWVTNGALSGTRRAINTVITSRARALTVNLVEAQGRLFFPGDDSQMIVTDGTDEGTFTVPADFPAMNLLCAISPENFYYWDLNVNGVMGMSALLHYQSGQIETVTSFGGAFGLVVGEQSQQFGSACFYQVFDRDNDNVVQMVRLDANGDATPIVLPLAANNSDRFLLVYRFRNKLILSRGAVFNGRVFPVNGLFEIQSRAPFLEELIFNADQLPFGPISDIRFTSDSIYLRLSAPPVIDFLPGGIARFDSDFQFSGDMQALNDSPGFSDIQVLNLQGGDKLYFENRRTFEMFGEDGLRPVAQASDVVVIKLFSEPELPGEAIYALGRDNSSGVSALYRLEESPNISERLVGLWGNPELDRQGLQLNTAVSADGQSRFLFMALLTFLGGDTFWLAGASRIVDGTDSINFTISRNTGLDFLNDSGQATNSPAGTATITLLGCNRLRLNLNLNPPLGTHEFEFERLVDQAFAEICID